MSVQCSGFRVQGSGFRVQGSGFRVQGSGFRVQGSGLGLGSDSGSGSMHMRIHSRLFASISGLKTAELKVSAVSARL